MTKDITFPDSGGFSFVNDGVRVDVHVEVGGGPARVVVKETALYDEQQQPIEPSEDNT